MICRNKNCPYQQNDECKRRINVITQMGLCSFWIKVQENRVGTDKFIKKGDADAAYARCQISDEDPVSEDAATKENE